MMQRMLVNQNKYFLITISVFFFGFLLIFIAGFRTLENYFDTATYLMMIHTYENIWDFEPTFWIINNINKYYLGGNEQIFFLLYAILGVSTKIFAIRKLSLLPIFSIYAYICLLFVLNEMTAIRAGVAVGVFLLAIPDIFYRNFKTYMIKILIAMAFHYSAIIFILVYFIDPKKINKKIFLLLPILAFIIAFIPNITLSIIGFIGEFLPGNIGLKTQAYLSLLDDDTYSTINRFNPFILSLTFIYYFSLFNIDKFKSKFDIIFLKLLGLQIFFFYFFFSIPVFAGRLSQFFAASLIIFLPHFILIFRKKLLPIILIMTFLTIYLISVLLKYTLLFQGY